MQTYIRIPKTEFSVFPLGLGTNRAGIRWDGKKACELFDCFLDRGSSLIDTSRVYSDWIPGEIGRSERVIGEWLLKSGKRNHVILSTKGGHPKCTGQAADRNVPRMTEKDMRYDLELSLKSLHTDVIDLYFYHRDNEHQCIEEIVETMETFRREGKIRYYSCSNWRAERIRKADAYCAEKGYTGFVADQALFNLGRKHMKAVTDDTLTCIKDDLQAYHEQQSKNLAMPYKSVADGFFHHYIQGGKTAVEDSAYYTEDNFAVVKRCRALMEKYDVTMTQVLLGFFTVQLFACLPLYGPRNIAQLEEAMRYIEIPFKKEDYEICV